MCLSSIFFLFLYKFQFELHPLILHIVWSITSNNTPAAERMAGCITRAVNILTLDWVNKHLVRCKRGSYQAEASICISNPFEDNTFIFSKTLADALHKHRLCSVGCNNMKSLPLVVHQSRHLRQRSQTILLLHQNLWIYSRFHMTITNIITIKIGNQFY
jgi:hypothetical protein